MDALEPIDGSYPPDRLDDLDNWDDPPIIDRAGWGLLVKKQGSIAGAMEFMYRSGVMYQVDRERYIVIPRLQPPGSNWEWHFVGVE